MSLLLQDWYRSEAADLLRLLEHAAQHAAEPTEMQRCARSLRGLARLAGDTRVAQAATALEQGTLQAQGDNTGERIQASIADLRALLEADESPDARDARVAASAARWALGEPLARAELPAEGERSFQTYVAREAAGLAETMERAVGAFVEQPANREWLATILRRQRALLGAARLEEVTYVAEALRAVEELAALIVRLNVPIKSEWLDVFRSAREVLRSAASSLEQGETPRATPALSRLRTLREELLDRYGDREPVERHTTDVLVPEAAPATPPALDARAMVRQRAATLHAVIERALGEDVEARRALDALRDLLLDTLQ
jgi:chemotaxis protein histidine kinase CheA